MLLDNRKKIVCFVCLIHLKPLLLHSLFKEYDKHEVTLFSQKNIERHEKNISAFAKKKKK